jgi:hypothetical protein
MKAVNITYILFLLFCVGCTDSKGKQRFVSIQTKNPYTQLLLDSKHGHVWQISRTTDGQTHKIPINTENLGSGFSSAGRFQLKPTPNVWNYILTDTKSGRMWRIQFSINDPKFRFISPIE